VQPPLVPHPYPLADNFTGRQTARRMLTDWFEGDSQPVLTLIAIGGMGKSALTWVWLRVDVLGEQIAGVARQESELAPSCKIPPGLRPEGVLWWSFYEQEASFPSFLGKALGYCSGGTIDPTAVSSNYDKLEELINQLHSRRLLVVLDGFERELRAYNALSAVYRPDAEHSDVQDFRACNHPLASAFLRRLAALNLRSRVLITTRLHPHELDGLAGCRREDLTALSLEDGANFLRNQGVKGTRGELEAIRKYYGGHPLTLRLIAGMISYDPIRPGDATAFARHDPVPNLVQRQNHVLAKAYESLPDPQGQLLSRLAAFRFPVNLTAVQAINPALPAPTLYNCLNDLRARGLLFFDRKDARYDMHPVVRQFAYDRLIDKTHTHSLALDYLATVTPSNADEVTQMNDLAPVIELFHHSVSAGFCDEAWRLYDDRLRKPLYYHLGEYDLDLQLLCSFFTKDGRLLLTDSNARIWVLLYQAIAYERKGRIREASSLADQAVQMARKLRDWNNLASALAILSSACVDLGELRRAMASASESTAIADRSGSRNWRGITHRCCGRVAAVCGNYEQARQEFAEAALAYGNSANFRQGMCWVHALTAQTCLWQGNPTEALAQAKTAQRLSRAGRYVNEDVIASSLVGAALIASAAGEGQKRQHILEEAISTLDEAMYRVRRIGLVGWEPSLWLYKARWSQVTGDTDTATACAVTGLALAERREYRLIQSEICVTLADLALRQREHKKAEEYARKALELATCDGEQWVHQSGEQDARDLLELINSTRVE
jgi:tetratricopeptide (TPR) repeat protein